MSIMESVGVCRLGGFAGSNPEIMGMFPSIEKNFSKEEYDEFMEKSMPHGSDPGTYILEKFKDKFILSYIFTIKARDEGVRNDLAAITVVVSDKKVNILEFEKLFHAIIEAFKSEMDSVSPQVLLNTLERIYNGVNKKGKIKLDKVVVDVPGIIKKQKLNLLKVDIKKIRGSFF